MKDKKRRGFKEWLRWLLLPKQESGMVVHVALDGYDEMARQIRDLTRQIDRLAEKANAAADAIDRLK